MIVSNNRIDVFVMVAHAAMHHKPETRLTVDAPDAQCHSQGADCGDAQSTLTKVSIAIQQPPLPHSQRGSVEGK